MKPKQLQLEQQIDRLFRLHRDSLDRMAPAELRANAARFRDAGGGGWPCGVRRLCAWTGRAALCLLAAAVTAAMLSSELVAGGYATQSTDWLAALDLSEHKLVRRVSHVFGLYNTETVRGMGECLLTNPWAGEAAVARPLCCGCRPVRIARVGVTEDNLTAVAEFIDSLYSRAVSSFLLSGCPAELSVSFAQLAVHVAAHRADFELGGNVVRTLPAAMTTPAVETEDCPEPPPAIRNFDELFPKGETNLSAAEPPAGRMLMWSFGHLPAARALRRLVPRPLYFGLRTERLHAISLLIAGRRHRQPGGGDGRGGGGGGGGGGGCDDRFRVVGDFSGRRALAYAVPLSGRLTVRLALKATCCRGGGDATDEATVTLSPGRVLFLPTDCYDLQVRRSESDDGPALLYFGFLYNGAHQAKREK